LEDLVSGKTRVDGFDKEWETVSFNQVIKPKARIGWQGLKKEEYLRSGYSYLIGGTDFHNGKVNLENISYVSKERYDMDSNIQVESNNVLVTKDGTIGKVALVPKLDKPATLNSGVFVFRTTSSLLPTFLYRVLLSSIFKEFINTLSAGSTIKHLYQKDLSNFEFRMPQDIREQQAIASVLTAMDEEIESLEIEKEKIMGIREGAMDDLLTGRVRLKL
jgi:type I restriction enzyme S subunit